MASSLERRGRNVGRHHAPGGRAFFLDWRAPTEKAEQAAARLWDTGTVQPDDLVVSAIWYDDPRPASRWVTQDDLSPAEKDRLLVVAQQALGVGWVEQPPAGTDREAWSLDDLTDDQLITLGA